jgi:ribonuclease PH
MRMAVDLHKLGQRTLTIDCDVIQADGGTRTASITGAYVALLLALRKLKKTGQVTDDFPVRALAAVSVGYVNNTPLLDLSYVEDRVAEVDLSVVMTEQDEFIEIQGTAERQPFSRQKLEQLLSLACRGIHELIEMQKRVIQDYESH